jgi:hypothetical protein
VVGQAHGAEHLVDEALERLGEPPGHVHRTQRQQDPDVLGTVGDGILRREQTQQIAPVDGQEQAARQVVANVVLDVVRLALELRGAARQRANLVLVARDERGDEGPNHLGRLEHRVHVLLGRPER